MITNTGRATIAAALALGGLGYVLGYVALVVLAVACLLAVVLAIVVVLLPLRVDLHREIAPLRVIKGEASVGMLTVRNLSRRSHRITATEPCGAYEVMIEVPRLPALGTRQVGYRLPTHRRGILTVGPIRWERSDLLGLLRRRQSLGDVQHLYVHPRVHLATTAASGRIRQLDAPSSDTSLQGSVTFHALREYAPGDDMRAIHWRSSARLGSLMVREHVDTALPHTTLILDTRLERYQDEDQFEEAIDFAASLVVAAVKAKSPVRLLTTGGLDVTGADAENQMREFLDHFAAMTPSSGSGFVDLPLTAGSGGFAGVLAAVGGELDEMDFSVLRTLAHRHADAALASFVQPGHSAPPAGGGLTVLTGSTAEQLVLRWNGWVAS